MDVIDRGEGFQLLMSLKLIKKLSATPTLSAQNEANFTAGTLDPQASLQANKAKFFFQLVY